MKVRISTRAKADLYEIGEWIERGNPARAATFVEELARTCFKLADSAFASPLLPRHEESGIRSEPHGAYLFFCTVTDGVEVVRVLHGARDYEKLLLP